MAQQSFQMLGLLIVFGNEDEATLMAVWIVYDDFDHWREIVGADLACVIFVFLLKVGEVLVVGFP